ncbi:hypothetical protein GW940_05305 [Candidatus Microgenomates bacterium]|nr:hypothetical protein [Candidatus Microgenomates bacterium]
MWTKGIKKVEAQALIAGLAMNNCYTCSGREEGCKPKFDYDTDPWSVNLNWNTSLIE